MKVFVGKNITPCVGGKSLNTARKYCFGGKIEVYCQAGALLEHSEKVKEDESLSLNGLLRKSFSHY